jgi:small subunit ribosomal protein S20
MANIKSAKKAMRQAEVRRKQNLARRTALKTATKKVRTALETTQDVDSVKTLLREAEAKFARAKSKGLIHANTASRKISRLAKRVAALEKGAA